MPLTLQPLNRREFCSNVLGGAFAAAFLATATHVQAQSTGRDRWVFLADTHIPGDPREERHGSNPIKNFAAIREAILKLEHKPKGVCIAGDIAFLVGTPEDCRQVAAQVAPFIEKGIPVHLVFGNHDHFDNFYAAFPDLKKEELPVENKHVAVLETPNASLFLLDSLYETDITSGFLGWQQLRWLRNELNARRNKPALLVAHHNLDNGAGTLMDREELWAIIRGATHVKGYIYGHTHVYQHSVRDNVHLINLPALAWDFQSGRQPLGWSDAELTESGIQLTLHTVADHPRNGDVRKFEWLR